MFIQSFLVGTIILEFLVDLRKGKVHFNLIE